MTIIDPATYGFFVQIVINKQKHGVRVYAVVVERYTHQLEVLALETT